MNTGTQTMNTLFMQLGLPHQDQEIETFVSKHNPLAKGIALTDASFWNGAQSAFLSETLAEEADWTALVGQLDTRLRH